MNLRLPFLLIIAALSALRCMAERAQTAALAPGVTFLEVAAFTQPPHYPMNRLLYVAADGNYYGTAPDGGAHSAGAIFRVTPGGASTTLVSFSGNSGAAKGASPDSGLVYRAADGALYGTTMAGGSYGCGTVFKVTTTGVFTTLVEFSDTLGSVKGSVPGELTLASDGNFYGTTQAGGASGCGTLFKMTPAGVVTTLVEFTGVSGSKLGSVPVGALVASGTTLYGVTQMGGTGGTTDHGTLFRYVIGGAFTTLVNFNASNGSLPAAGLCLHSDGALYGTTEFGGSGDFGVVFKYNLSTSSFSLLRQFASTDGAQPAGELLQGADNALYGTTCTGGANGRGTVFKITTSGTHTVLASFTGTSGAVPGDTPRAGLIATPGGAFAGTTSAGGVGGFGTCFTITSAGVFTNLLHFSTAEGWSPAGGPTFAATGEMLVPLSEGGAKGFGTMHTAQSSGLTILSATFGSPVGETPVGSLLDIGDEYIGATTLGGASGRGTFFKYKPGEGTTTFGSSATTNQASPVGPPVVGPDGLFYAATRGVSSGKGAIVRFGANGSISSLVTFSGKSGSFKGTRPHGPLALGVDGCFYGTTEAGGADDRGTIFKVTTDGTFTTLVEFGTAPQPNTPLGGLTRGPDGNFYGTTSKGGTSDYGTVFKITPSGTLTVLVNFTDSSGAALGSEATGPLLVAFDGTIYGTTAQGGDAGKGTLFRISPTGTMTTLAQFTGSSGNAAGTGPEGGLVFGPDGLLYGTTPQGGTAGGGNVFRLQHLSPHAGTDQPLFSPGAATLQGWAQTGGEATNVAFEYGSTPALGSSTAASSTGSSGSPAAFSAVISGLTPGTTIYYRAIATNPSGTSSGLMKSFVVPAPLAAWKLETFGDENAADLDDADGDGTPNLTEYALLSSPTYSDQASKPAPTVRNYAEGQRLSLTVRRDPARSDITIAVQASASASGPWTTVATSTLGAPFSGPGYVSGDAATPGVKTVEIRDIVNLADAPSRFMRVHISH